MIDCLVIILQHLELRQRWPLITKMFPFHVPRYTRSIIIKMSIHYIVIKIETIYQVLHDRVIGHILTYFLLPKWIAPMYVPE
ncbi:CPXV152A protein [Cowpox virus]|uniref:CPXV152A protein n=1 Tax=Cowpox virus TaxID=10243 RepID=U5T9F4_COWPX|nr:CPXV152A protein [Cowpox virus]